MLTTDQYDVKISTSSDEDFKIQISLDKLLHNNTSDRIKIVNDIEQIENSLEDDIWIMN